MRSTVCVHYWDYDHLRPYHTRALYQTARFMFTLCSLYVYHVNHGHRRSAKPQQVRSDYQMRTDAAAFAEISQLVKPRRPRLHVYSSI